MTTFLRLLKDSDKATALESSLRSYSQGAPDPDRTFRVDPDKFRKVPNTPFAYWVDDSIRDLFQKLPPFESEGRTVRVGLQTSDDFRFVRAWWEVDADRRLDPGLGGAPDWKTDLPAFQAWCRNRTRQGKYWVPFAKGGEYSPYYSDIHLVVNWKDEGEEIKNFADPKTGKTYSRPQNTEYYFRPGVTWSYLPKGRGFFGRLPAGSCFGHGGNCISAPLENLSTLLGYLNGKIYLGLLHLLMARGVGETAATLKYEVGYVRSIPVPSSFCLDQYREPAMILSRFWGKVANRVSIDQTFCVNAWSSNFVLAEVGDIIDSDVQTDTDKTVASSVELSDTSLRILIAGIGTPAELSIERKLILSIETGFLYLCERRFEDTIGFVFGRWDTRPAGELVLNNQEDLFAPIPVCPPAALVSSKALPATSGSIVSEEWLRARPDAISLPPPGSVARPTIPDSEYPIPIPWDGILAEDPDNPDDLMARIRLVLRVLHGNGAEQVERELAEGLGVQDLRDYVSDPQGFFDAHLKTYSKSRRKAPIYWPLSTKSGGYTVWVYYPRLSDATLYAVHELARKKAEVLDLERAELAGRSGRSRAEQQRFDRVSRDAVEVRDFAQEVLRIAGLPYKPDHDDGVPICAAPLYGLFRHSGWSKYLKETWEELQEGTYDWAHLAYALWPDRVREKARADRSLAIAHGLEDLR